MNEVVVRDIYPPPLWSSIALPDRAHFEPDPLALLEPGDDVEEVPRLRIAIRPEHAHEALRRFSGECAQGLEAERRVDEIAQGRLGRFHFAREEAFDAFSEQLFPEGRVAHDPCLNRFPEIPRERHGWFSCVGGASA